MRVPHERFKVKVEEAIGTKVKVEVPVQK